MLGEALPESADGPNERVRWRPASCGGVLAPVRHCRASATAVSRGIACTDGLIFGDAVTLSCAGVPALERLDSGVLGAEVLVGDNDLARSSTDSAK